MGRTLEFLLKYKVFIFIFFLGFFLSFAIRKEKTVEVIRTVQVAQAPVIQEKEVEKIVYKDSPQTLETLKSTKESACLFGASYILLFNVIEDLMEAYDSPVHQDWYDVNNSATKYLVNCE